MARPLSGNIGVALQGAIRRTQSVLERPPFDDFFGKHHPQHQALERLRWLAGDDEAKGPHRFLDPKALLPIPGSWALFQLYERILVLAAWRRREMPETLEEHDVSTIFHQIGHADLKTSFFPEGNISPQAWMALMKSGKFTSKIDFAVWLESREDGNVANFTHGSIQPYPIPLPENIWLNPETNIWEARS